MRLILPARLVPPAAHPLPSRRARRWRRWLGGACIAGAAVASAVSLFTLAPRLLEAVLAHPFFSVTRFEIEGNARLADQEVLEWLGAKPGMSIWWVDPRVWRAKLLAHPWIQSAQVRRELPRRVEIRIRERWPVAVVRWRGTFQYVDRTGHFLGAAEPLRVAEFPLLTLPESAELRPQGELQVGLRFLRLCARLGYADQISEVVADRSGVTVYPLSSRTAVVLGRGQWRERLLRSSRVFAAWQGEWDRLERVDVSFRNVVVVRVRDAEKKPRSAPPRKRLGRESV